MPQVQPAVAVAPASRVPALAGTVLVIEPVVPACRAGDLPPGVDYVIEPLAPPGGPLG